MEKFKGNFRLLFVKQKVDELDISSALSDIDPKILNSKTLEFFTDQVIIEFFCHPASSEFSASPTNIGRFITGYEQAAFDTLNFKDFTKTEDNPKEVVMSDSWEIFFGELAVCIPENSEKWSLIIKDDFSKVELIVS